MSQSLDDNALMALIRQGNQRGLVLLYERHGKAVYSLALRIVQVGTTAEEVTQDTFLKVWDKQATYDPTRGTPKNWLLAITQFTAIDRLRREHRQPALIGEAIDDETVESLVARYSANTQWQEASMLHILVAQLPPEQALMIELAFFQGMTHAEISETLHIPLGTVKTRVRTGLQKLRSLWKT
jgi:RNA polymerase sigma-70 factor (ECF subfamily)